MFNSCSVRTKRVKITEHPLKHPQVGPDHQVDVDALPLPRTLALTSDVEIDDDKREANQTEVDFHFQVSSRSPDNEYWETMWIVPPSPPLQLSHATSSFYCQFQSISSSINSNSSSVCSEQQECPLDHSNSSEACELASAFQSDIDRLLPQSADFKFDELAEVIANVDSFDDYLSHYPKHLHARALQILWKNGYDPCAAASKMAEIIIVTSSTAMSTAPSSISSCSSSSSSSFSSSSSTHTSSSSKVSELLVNPIPTMDEETRKRFVVSYSLHGDDWKIVKVSYT